MISQKMVQAVNDQINAELYSAYLYWAMSSFATYKSWDGTASWLLVQGQEEMTHAQRLYNYVHSQGEHAVLGAIEAPPVEFESLLKIFEETLAHEKKVTALINDLVDLAREERDHATEIFLQWFVTEQIEEEESAAEILGKLEMVGDNGGGLYMIDRELATRVFTMPVDLVAAGA